MNNPTDSGNSDSLPYEEHEHTVDGESERHDPRNVVHEDLIEGEASAAPIERCQPREVNTMNAETPNFATARYSSADHDGTSVPTGLDAELMALCQTVEREKQAIADAPSDEAGDPPFERMRAALDEMVEVTPHTPAGLAVKIRALAEDHAGENERIMRRLVQDTYAVAGLVVSGALTPNLDASIAFMEDAPQRRREDEARREEERKAKIAAFNKTLQAGQEWPFHNPPDLELARMLQNAPPRSRVEATWVLEP